MIRLIDADALMNSATIHWSATTYESCIPVDAVDGAPTIDAIPVGWLQKQRELPLPQQNIYTILYMWRKEQEANNAIG